MPRVSRETSEIIKTAKNPLNSGVFARLACRKEGRKQPFPLNLQNAPKNFYRKKLCLSYKFFAFVCYTKFLLFFQCFTEAAVAYIRRRFADRSGVVFAAVLCALFCRFCVWAAVLR